MPPQTSDEYNRKNFILLPIRRRRGENMLRKETEDSKVKTKMQEKDGTRGFNKLKRCWGAEKVS